MLEILEADAQNFIQGDDEKKFHWMRNGSIPVKVQFFIKVKKQENISLKLIFQAAMKKTVSCIIFGKQYDEILICG